MSDVASRYLDDALSYIEQRSVKRDLVDWARVRVEARQLASDAVERADTYPAIRAALRALGDNHSFLVPAQERAQRMQGSWTGLGLHAFAPDGVIVQVYRGSPADRAGLSVGDTIVAVDGEPVVAAEARPLPLYERERVVLEVRRHGTAHTETVTLEAAPYNLHLLPEGTLLKEHIGYVRVPEHPWDGVRVGERDPGQEYAETAQRIIADLEAQGAQKWVVDLRQNPGGNMYPMIAGLGPLLGEGTCCYFVGPDGTRQPISYRNGEASDSYTVQMKVDAPYSLTHPAPPVAVLIGPLTASSGEFITLALRNRPATRLFGQPTFGLSTGNETKELSDGALLFLTVCLGADRSGETFDGPIPPDVVVPTTWSTFGTSEDAVVAAGITWIETVRDVSVEA